MEFFLPPMISSEEELMTPHGQSFTKHLVSLMLCVTEVEGKVDNLFLLELFQKTLIDSAMLDQWQAVNEMYWRLHRKLYAHLSMSYQAGQQSMVSTSKSAGVDGWSQTQDPIVDEWMREYITAILEQVVVEAFAKQEQEQKTPIVEKEQEWITVKGGARPKIIQLVPEQEKDLAEEEDAELPITPIKKIIKKRKKVASPSLKKNPSLEAPLQVSKMTNAQLTAYMKKGTDEDNLILVSMELKKRETFVDTLIKGSMMFIMAGSMIVIPNFSIKVKKSHDEQNYIESLDMLNQIILHEDDIPLQDLPLIRSIKGMKEIIGVVNKPDIMTFFAYSLSALGCIKITTHKQHLSSASVIRTNLLRILTQVHVDFFWGNLMTSRTDAALASGAFFDLKTLIGTITEEEKTDRIKIFLGALNEPVVFNACIMPLYEAAMVAAAMIVLNGWGDVGGFIEDSKIMVHIHNAWDLFCVDVVSKLEVELRACFFDAVGRLGCAIDAMTRAENSRQCLQDLCPIFAPVYDWVMLETPPSSEFVLGQNLTGVRMMAQLPHDKGLTPDDPLIYHLHYPENIKKMLGKTLVLGSMSAISLSRKIEMRIMSVIMDIMGPVPPAKSSDVSYAFTLAWSFVTCTRELNPYITKTPDAKVLMEYMIKVFKTSGCVEHPSEMNQCIRALIFDD